MRDIMGRSIIKQWYYGIFKKFIEEPAFHLILVFAIFILLTRTYSPTIVALVTFTPPAIQDTQVDSAIGRDLHAAGPAGLHWAQRGVKPDVYSLDQIPGHFYVVIFNKDYVLSKLRGVGHLHYLVDEFLAVLILWMGFATEDNLYRTLFVS